MLTPYDVAWPRRFSEAAAHLQEHGNPDWLIEHIGSTAVRGLIAKPIIDLAVRLDRDDELDEHLSNLEAHGWRTGSSVTTHAVLVFENNGTRERVAHFFIPDVWPTANQRLFRDWLISHPADAHRYARAKIHAARSGDYNRAKTATVQQIMDRARASLGLPIVDVNDKR